jgi:hypothetical protein
MVPAWAAGKDSPLVTATRKKLETRVTVDFKDTRLEEVVEELKRQVEDLSVWLDAAGGVSRNQPFTYKATNKPLAQALDEMFKKTDLGYVIGQPKDNRYHGWVIIKKGKSRGGEAQAAKPPVRAQPAAPPAVTQKPAVKAEDSPEQAEKDAARKLKLAERLDDDGLHDKAKPRYQEIIDKYPNTKAAKEARARLEKLDK